MRLQEVKELVFLSINKCNKDQINWTPAERSGWQAQLNGFHRASRRSHPLRRSHPPLPLTSVLFSNEAAGPPFAIPHPSAPLDANGSLAPCHRTTRASAAIAARGGDDFPALRSRIVSFHGMREGSWLRNTHIRMDTRQLLAGARVAHPGPAAYEAWPWRTSWPHPLYHAGFGTVTSWLLDSRCRTRIKSIHSQNQFIWTGLDPHLQREEKGVSSIATSSHHTRSSIITSRPTQRIQHSTALSLSLYPSPAKDQFGTSTQNKHPLRCQTGPVPECITPALY
ncbi:hypothetical protein K456DRAFT_1051734 [Colletotrichum gloeosporioides 23]|nr:hypothetical protein K456DRAFT_1051734 [Colletotrichum gloeosporioides 23]